MSQRPPQITTPIPCLRLQKQRLGPHRAQRDPARPQLEELRGSAAGAGDGNTVVFQDALADDSLARSADMERILSSVDRSSRPVDLCWAESFLRRHAVHDALHRLFIAAVRPLHFHAETETNGKASGVAAVPIHSDARGALRCHRRNPQPTPTCSGSESLLVDHPDRKSVV